jgi:hypothetical protein
MMDQVTTSERSASSLHTVAGHAEHVYLIAEGATPPPYTEDFGARELGCPRQVPLGPVLRPPFGIGAGAGLSRSSGGRRKGRGHGDSGTVHNAGVGGAPVARACT